MAINLATKFEPNALKAFKIGSVVKGRSNEAYSFDGVRSIQIYTLGTVPVTDYNRSAAGNRYGTPQEVQDTVQILELTRDKSFTGIIDKGNAEDQMNVKKASQWLRQEMDEIITPMMDKYALGRYVRNAGKVIGAAAAPDHSWEDGGILPMLSQAVTHMNNKRVPKKGRTLYIGETAYSQVMLTKEFIGLDKLGEQAFDKHMTGRIYGMDVVPVPDDYLPEGCYFLVAYRRSVVSALKINDCKIHQDPPGINGHLIEGRFYHDAFVLGTYADGVYACVAQDKKLAAPTIAEDGSVNGRVNITCANADRIVYTTDGTDPRYSKTAQIYSAAFTLTETATVKAVGYDDATGAYFTSDVAEMQITV